MYRKLLIAFSLFVSLFTGHLAQAQLTVTTGLSATDLISAIEGMGITISSPVLTCDTASEGSFMATGTLLEMTNGIVLTNGKASACSGLEGALASHTMGTSGDTDMVLYGTLPPGTATFDACILEFDFTGEGEVVGVNYQFGAEEYRNAVCSEYNDAFAIFVSGPGIAGIQNIAKVPGTTIPVEINSINDGTPGSVGGARLPNCTDLGPGSPFTSLYIDNAGGTFMTYRGYTKNLRAIQTIVPMETYHMKFSIVDAGNANYDAGVFIEGLSLDTSSIGPGLYTASLANSLTGFSLYPNPAKTSIMVSGSKALEQISICNLIGQVVFVKQNRSTKETIDISALPQGVYFVKVNNSLVRSFVKE